jgi:hypothetical protein
MEGSHLANARGDVGWRGHREEPKQALHRGPAPRGDGPVDRANALPRYLE